MTRLSRIIKSLSFRKRPVKDNEKDNIMFTIEEKALLVQAIRLAEGRTDGEIRLCIEPTCSSETALVRAEELFASLKMQETKGRTGVLLYIATKDKRFAIYGDTGIYSITGQAFWNTEAERMRQSFKQGLYVAGVINCISDIGDVLAKHFPISTGKQNELPDDIVEL